MKLLILTQYYPPEVGAPQNRLHELAIRLQKSGVEVEVLTAMPNYPKMEILTGYEKGKIKEEIIDGIPVHRSKIYVSHSKSIIPRLLNYFSFVWTSYWRGRKLNSFDFLLVESPPLFLGYSAIALSRKLNAKMIFNVSDLWPESAEKMNIVNNKVMLKMAYKLESKCYRKATIITGQTMGIVDNIKKRFPASNVHWLPNGVDLNFYNPTAIESSGFRERNGLAEDDIVFFYGGIIGHAQGLQLLLLAAERVVDVPAIKIVIQGAGPEKDELLEMKEKLKLPNVLFLPPVNKLEMPSILKEVDVALVPLRKLDIFQGAIPSKVFEALAMKKALLLGVDGEARQHFIERGKAGLYYEPENLDALVTQLKAFASHPEIIEEMGENARKYVGLHFDRNNIASDFLKVLNNN